MTRSIVVEHAGIIDEPRCRIQNTEYEINVSEIRMQKPLSLSMMPSDSSVV